MSAAIATSTQQPNSTRDQQLDDFYARQREARARLDALYAQIAQAKRDVTAAAWAIEGYRNRGRAAQQVAGGAR